MEEGIAAIVQAEHDGYSDWALPLKLAEVYCERNDFPAALECCRKFTCLKDKLADSHESYDDGSRESYNEAYYGRVLLREGECHKNLRCTQPAVRCYMEVLEHEDVFGDAHQEALFNIFEVWRESKEYTSVIDLFRTWRDIEKPGLFHWIMKIAHLNSVHVCLLDAARSTASHEEIIDAYRLALQNLLSQSDADDDDTKQAINQFRYVLAAILFYGSNSRSNQHEALDIWEALIFNQNDALNSWPISLGSARKLFRSLYELASQTPVESGCRYTARLAKLAAMDHEDIRIFRQGGKDPRLPLARIQYVRGHTDDARLTLRERLRSAFDGWSNTGDDEDRLAGRYSSLAHSLVVICDDVNAIAAWQATKPKVKKTTQMATTVDNASGEQAGTGADDLSASDLPLGQLLQSSHIAPVEASPEQETQSQQREPYQAEYYCDGDCGTDFDVSSNSFVCRDCLDVQLCSACHAKLKDGEISPMFCNSSHEFLHVPLIDRTLWEKMHADQMILGDALVSRDVWVDGLRREWNLEQEQIDTEKLEAGRKLKAARCIARFILTWKRGQRRKSAVSSGG